MKTSIILCLPILIASCKFSTKSGLKHKLGQVQRATGKLTCSQEPIPEEYSKTYNYSRAILERIITSNRDLIKGEHADPDRYCIHIMASDTINASADNSGNIYVYFGIFSLTDNDANFASVMAHEIAHVLNDHSFISTQHRDLDKSKMTLADRQYYDILISTAKEIDSNLHQYITENDKNFERYTTEIRKAKVKHSEEHSRQKFFEYNSLLPSIVDQISLKNTSGNPTNIKDGLDLFSAVTKKKFIPGLEVSQGRLMSAREDFMNSITPYSSEALLKQERDYYSSIFRHTNNMYQRSVFRIFFIQP